MLNGVPQSDPEQKSISMMRSSFIICSSSSLGIVSSKRANPGTLVVDFIVSCFISWYNFYLHIRRMVAFSGESNNKNEYGLDKDKHIRYLIKMRSRLLF